MLTPREKALEILGFPKGSNPNQNKILKAVRQSLDKLCEEHVEDDSVYFKERDRIDRAGEILHRQFPRETIILSDGTLGEVNSQENLLKLLMGVLNKLCQTEK